MIVGFKARQGRGKTASMVATLLDLIGRWGFSASEAVGNVSVNLDGFTKLNNKLLREYVAEMCHKGFKHKIILIDEIDRVFPARFWQQKEQTETLLGLWQDEKLFNWILYTAHLGKAIDKIIRDCTQIVVIPEYSKLDDTIFLTVINGLELTVSSDTIYPVSSLWTPKLIYDRWEVVT